MAGEAKSYAERLFDYPAVGPLSDAAAMEAIRTPVLREGVEIEENTLAMIVEKTKGYPYFLQEWGSRAWDAAAESPITVADVDRATTDVLRQLDTGFFRVRLDRLTPREKDYMCAMASLGPGPHRSGEIAHALRIDVTQAGPLRKWTCQEGMVFVLSTGTRRSRSPCSMSSCSGPSRIGLPPFRHLRSPRFRANPGGGVNDRG